MGITIAQSYGKPPLNKPVVVSEEALVAPVVVPDVSAASVTGTSTTTASMAKMAAGPAYVVLAGISFSHFLNDTMQSLIASVYPILKDSYALDLDRKSTRLNSSHRP